MTIRKALSNLKLIGIAVLFIVLDLGCSSTAGVGTPSENSTKSAGGQGAIDVLDSATKGTDVAKTEEKKGAQQGEEGTDNATATHPIRKETMVGYYAWWMKGAWIDLDLEVYDRIIFFTTTPGSDGKMQSRNGWPHAWVSLLARTDSLGIQVVPALALMEADSIKTLFGSRTNIGNLLETALDLVKESRGAGVHLDIELFEAVSDSMRDGFFQFTDSLAERMAQDWPNAKLSMFAPAFDYDGLYDLNRIHPGFSQIMVSKDMIYIGRRVLRQARSRR